MKMTGPWRKASVALGAMANPMIYNRAFDRAALKEAHRLRRIMVEAFQDGGPKGMKWEPLSFFTQITSAGQGKIRDAKGRFSKTGRQPLSLNGDLRNSIAVVKEGDIIFVGTHRSARSSNGGSLVNLALIHNYGTKTYTVPVTEKMRRFFMWLSIKTGGKISPLSKSTTHLTIRIPPRPWVEPVWDAEADNSVKNIRKEVMDDIIKAAGLGALI